MSQSNCPRACPGDRSFRHRLVLPLCLALLLPVTALHAQQFRAAWADVFHVGMQNSAQVDTMVTSLVAGHYNAVIVQVVAFMDTGTKSHGAYFKSGILPWSGYTTASFDPLAYLCQQAHANGIEVHAWLGGSAGGMYRVSNVWPPPGNATLAAHPEWMMVPYTNSEDGVVVGYPTTGSPNFLLDMGSPDAQEYIVSIIRELVTNYPIDGINWDDEIDGTQYGAGMGYPVYSTAVNPRSGLARYRRNTGYAGTPAYNDTAWSNYRRRFKNELIARCQAEIQSIKTNPRQPLLHSAATIAYGNPPGTCDFTASTAYLYFSDWAMMLQKGWLDAAIPMDYKNETNNAAMFRAWCDRSFSCWRYNRHIYMGLGAYMNKVADTLTQLQYVYNSGLNGGVTYSYGVPSSPPGDWWNSVSTNLYINTATVPALPWRNPATATEGMMWGRVMDGRTGLYVDDATVTVTSGPTVKTDGNGYYVATLIPATAGGTVHSTTASKTGMLSQANPSATVLAGDVVRYDFVLNDYPPKLTVLPTATNTVVVKWPSPSPGWTLQQFNSLNSTNWSTPVQTVNDDGTNKWIVVSAGPASRYYRLWK